MDASKVQDAASDPHSKPPFVEDSDVLVIVGFYKAEAEVILRG